MKLEDQLAEFSLLGKQPEITDEIVQYYRQNPHELDLLTDKGQFHSRFLMYFFILGLVLTVGARLLRYFFEGDFGELIDRVLLDVISEIGIAVFGGAVTVYFLEHLKKKQYQESIKLRKEIKRRIKELEQNQPLSDLS